MGPEGGVPGRCRGVRVLKGCISGEEEACSVKCASVDVRKLGAFWVRDYGGSDGEVGFEL